MSDTRSSSRTSNHSATGVKVETFGRLPDGREVRSFTLVPGDGSSATVSEYGGILLDLRVPDREGVFENVLLGYPDLASYLGDPYYIGAVVGRFANRIGDARALLDGEILRLTPNLGWHHLHGGREGFGKKLWAGRVLEGDTPAVALEYTSPDGDEGYPGNLWTQVVYRMPRPGELAVEITARSDRPTPVNLTLHPYFNLTGKPGSIHDHVVTLEGGHVLEVDRDSIPTGRRVPVEGTPFDFRSPHPVGERIEQDHPLLNLASGYDQCWVQEGAGGAPRCMAHVEDPASGRRLEVLSDAPAIQFYAGNFLGTEPGYGWEKGLAPRCGFALEPQTWPDAPNHSDFPDAILRPGQEYSRHIIYRCGVNPRP